MFYFFVINFKCFTFYFIKCVEICISLEVHMEGGKHLDHNIVVALCTENFNIYRESLN